MSFAQLDLKNPNTEAEELFEAQLLGDISSLTSALQLIATQQARITQLEAETETDALTGLLNGRGFQRALGREIERARRNNAPRAMLVLFDLDGLKAINDTQGHQAGDSYIAGFAGVLRAAVRTTDYVARLGGDEFALLLVDGDVTHLTQRVDTLAHDLNHEIVKHKGRPMPVRVSHGAVSVTPLIPADTLVARADKALYRDKTARRILNKYCR